MSQYSRQIAVEELAYDVVNLANIPWPVITQHSSDGARGKMKWMPREVLRK